MSLNNKLTTKEYWRLNWLGTTLPVIAKPNNDVNNILGNILPNSKENTLIEIGCAPGGWMAYFYNKYNYSVSGIEYVDDAAALTKHNMELQGIEAEIFNLDFFEAKIAAASYDIVFSGGFIEHFEDLNNVVNKITELSKQYVVTLVPNLNGVNGCISKLIRPNVFYSHNQIDAKLLRCLHEAAGLNTIFCNYVGGLQFIMPAEKTIFFDKHQRFSRVINLPFIIFNKISIFFSKHFYAYPRNKFLSKSLMYIGKK